MPLRVQVAVAVGINCSVGPDQLVSVVRNIKENVSIPVIAKPNAGMPTIDDQGNAIYSMDAKSFAEHMKVLIEMVRLLLEDAVVLLRNSSAR